jgi:hypothetical protein
MFGQSDPHPSQAVETPFLPGILYSSSHISVKFHDINQDDEKGGQNMSPISISRLPVRSLIQKLQVETGRIRRQNLDIERLFKRIQREIRRL